ncbi:MAG: HAD family hydrolase [Huintestinicola sp.]
MIKFIAADLDGTLLDSEKKLPEGFFDLVRKMKRAGITFAAASGRQYPGVASVFQPVIDEMTVICENGGAAFEKGRMIYSDPMPFPDVLRMAEEISRVDDEVNVLLSAADTAYVLSSRPEFYEYASRFCGRLESIASFEDIRCDILKIAVCDPIAEKRAYPIIRELEPSFNVILSGDRWVDIVALHVNKGSAVRNLMKQQGIGFDEAMVFGDYLNDLEMMSACKYSFAMENGHPDLIAAANYTAPSNDDNGVVRTILNMLPQLAENSKGNV